MNKFFNTFAKYALLSLACLLCVMPDVVLAAGTPLAGTPVPGAGEMPWNGPLEKIRDALTGGAAKAIAVIAMAVAGGMLAFGGELSEFAKRICMVVIAASTMVFALKIMQVAGLA